jgi:putative flippase GtrA
MRTWISQFTGKQAHPAIQFIKYAICGGVATGVDMLAFFACAWKVLPALTPDDPLVRLLGVAVSPIDPERIRLHFVLCNGIAFILSNFTAYFLNIAWVFHGGKHRRHMEIILFFAVSIFSVVVGTALGWAMMKYFNSPASVSYAGKVIASILINYVCRKYLVFKG